MSENKTETIKEIVIRYILLTFSVTVKFFSQISLSLKFALKLPRLYHIGKKVTVKDETK